MLSERIYWKLWTQLINALQQLQFRVLLKIPLPRRIQLKARPHLIWLTQILVHVIYYYFIFLLSYPLSFFLPLFISWVSYYWWLYCLVIGRPQLIQQAQPESVRRKIFVIDDNSRVAGCIDDSYSDTECDSGVQPPYPLAPPDVENETTKSAEVHISHNSPETPSKSDSTVPTPEGWDNNDCSSVENIHISGKFLNNKKKVIF